MPERRIVIRGGFYLSGVSAADKPALLEHLRTRDVYETTLNIPYPYTGADADWWIGQRVEHTRRSGREVTFAVRTAEGRMVGAVGADGFEVGSSHRAEIGYWLAKPFWGRGLMTDAVGAYARYAFGELGLERLVAQVFFFNMGSARVLEKNGFRLEGRLRGHARKEGRLLDVLYFGLLKGEEGV